MKSFFVFILLGFIRPALGLLLLPIFLEFIPVNEYGFLILIASFIAVFSILSNLKLDSALRTIYFDFNKTIHRKLFFKSIFSFQLLLTFFWLILIISFGKFIFEFLFVQNIPFYPYVFMALVTALLASLNNLYFIYLQNKLALKLYSFLTIISVLSTGILQITLVYFYNYGLYGYLMGGLISKFIVLTTIIVIKPKLLNFYLDKTLIIKGLKFSVLFIPFLLLLGIESQLDRFLLEKYKSISVVAQYGFLITISGIGIIVINALDNALRPLLYEFLSNFNKNKIKPIKELIFQYLFIVLIAISAIVFIGNYLDFFISKSTYLVVEKYIPVLTFLLIPYSFVRILSLIFIHEKRIKFLNYVMVFKLIIIAILLSLLIPTYGIYGILLTLIISNTLNAVLFYRLISKEKRKLLSRNISVYIAISVIFNTFLLLIENSDFKKIVTASLLCFFLAFFLFLNYEKFKLKLNSFSQ